MDKFNKDINQPFILVVSNADAKTLMGTRADAIVDVRIGLLPNHNGLARFTGEFEAMRAISIFGSIGSISRPGWDMRRCYGWQNADK